MNMSVSVYKTFLSPVHFMNNSKLEKVFVIFAVFWFFCLKLGCVEMLIFHVLDHSKCPWIKHSRIRFYLSIVWYPFIILIQYLSHQIFSRAHLSFPSHASQCKLSLILWPNYENSCKDSPSIFLSKLNIIYRIILS